MTNTRNCKKPIVAIINLDTADIVKDNKLGFTANPGNIDAIKNGFYSND
jgi:hypothetical protein